MTGTVRDPVIMRLHNLVFAKHKNLVVVCDHLIAQKWLQLYFTCTGLARVGADEYEC